jgi:hypothetical protein
MQLRPYQINLSAPILSVLYKLIIGLWFVQLDPQMTTKILIFFDLTPDFSWFQSLKSCMFCKFVFSS